MLESLVLCNCFYLLLFPTKLSPFEGGPMSSSFPYPQHIGTDQTEWTAVRIHYLTWSPHTLKVYPLNRCRVNSVQSSSCPATSDWARQLQPCSGDLSTRFHNTGHPGWGAVTPLCWTLLTFLRGSMRQSIGLVHWVMAEVNLGPEKKAELSCWTGIPRDPSGQPSSLPGKSFTGVEDGASTEIHTRSTPLSHKNGWRIMPNQSLCQMSCHSEASQCQCPNICLHHLLSWLGSQPPLY